MGGLLTAWARKVSAARRGRRQPGFGLNLEGPGVVRDQSRGRWVAAWRVTATERKGSVSTLGQQHSKIETIPLSQMAPPFRVEPGAVAITNGLFHEVLMRDVPASGGCTGTA